MTQHRLRWLLAVLGGLLALRWIAPPQPAPGVAMAEAVVRPARPGEAGSSPGEDRVAQRSPEPVEADTDVPGNAFATRRVKAPDPPPEPAKPPSPPRPAPVVHAAPPAPPPLPPPALQVIGRWDDGVAPALIVATPNDTLLARPGTVLMAEYRVTEITPRQLVLVHIASQREWRLPVPQAASP